MGASHDQMNAVRRLKEKVQEELLRKANVVAVGIGCRWSDSGETGKPAIIVSVTHKVPRRELASHDLIPRELEGVPIEVRAIGTLQPDSTGRAQTEPAHR